MVNGNETIEVPEGTYKVTVANNGWGGTREITVNRDELLNGGFNYAEVEAEMKTLEEHISALEGHGKSKALGILRLIHKMLDDVNEVLGNPS